MDVLSDVLRVVRLSGAVFFTAEFSAPWALDSPNPELLGSIVMPEAECLSLFHILMEGECIVECPTHPPDRMESGDVVVFPHGQPHTMRSHDGIRPAQLDYVLSQGSGDELPAVSFGGGGSRARFICGYLNCDQRFGPLFGALPSMLLVRSRTNYTAVETIDGSRKWPGSVPQASGTWLATTLKFTVHEAQSHRPGNAAMLGRLTELMFVEIIREYMQGLAAGQRGWLAGLRDPHVGRALQLLHGDPVRNWTVDELAHEVATSRSSLAQRFTELIGESPIRYLSNWRIQLAKQMLRGGDSVQAVAARIGYESEPAFSRAFKRATGSPPASWRRVARTPFDLTA